MSRTIRLLLALHARRLWNRWRSGFRRKPADGGQRQPTGRRRRGFGWLMILIIPAILLQSGAISLRAIGFAAIDPAATQHLPSGLRSMVWETGIRPTEESLIEHFRLEDLPPDQQQARLQEIRTIIREQGDYGFLHKDSLHLALRAIAGDAPPHLVRERMLQTLALLLLVLLLATMLVPVGSDDQDHGRPDGSTTWLRSLPIGDGAFATAEFLRLWILSPLYWLTVPIFLLLSVLAVGGGGLAAWATLPVAVLLGSAVAAGSSILRADIARLGPATRRYARGLCLLLGMLLLSGLIALVHLSFAPTWWVWIQSWAHLVLAPVIALLAGLSGTPSQIASTLLLCLIVAMIAAPVAVLVQQQALRRGDVDAGAAGRRGRRPGSWTPLQPGGKDLLLLLRDVRLLMQVAVVPAVIIGINLLINKRLLFGQDADLRALSATALACGGYQLVLIAPRVLGTDGPALASILATPTSLTALLWRKTLLWTTTGLGFSLAAWGIVFALAPQRQLVADLPYILLAVIAFAALILPLGALAFDPHAPPGRQVRAGTLYLGMLILSVLIGALFLPVWPRLVHLGLIAAMALGAWQRLTAQDAWILDPIHSAPRRLDLWHALLWIWWYFVVQSVLAAALLATGVLEQTAAVAIASAGAALLILLLSPLILRPLPDGARLIGLRSAATRPVGLLLIAPLLGLACAMPALLWQDLAGRAGWLPEQALAPAAWLWLLVLAVLVAPPIEEFLFRGLLQGGLRSSLRPGWAILLAAVLFALIHPPVSFPAVLLLGLVAGVVAQRGGWLLPAVLVHASYNACVIGWSWWLAV